MLNLTFVSLAETFQNWDVYSPVTASASLILEDCASLVSLQCNIWMVCTMEFAQWIEGDLYWFKVYLWLYNT